MLNKVHNRKDIKSIKNRFGSDGLQSQRASIISNYRPSVSHSRIVGLLEASKRNFESIKENAGLCLATTNLRGYVAYKVDNLINKVTHWTIANCPLDTQKHMI